MGSLNKVLLIGRLGKDPEIRYTQSGNAVAHFSIATSESWTDPQGQRQEKTEWHEVVAWNKLADLAQSYLKQGSQIYIEGRLQTRSWDDQQTGQKRFRTEINARTFQFLDSRPNQDGMASNQQTSSTPQQNQPTSNAPQQNQQNQQNQQDQGDSSEGGVISEPQNNMNPSPSNAGPRDSPPVPPAESYIEDDIPF